MSESHAVLDLTGFRETLPVKCGGKEYELVLDMPTALYVRVQRWVMTIEAANADTDEAKTEGESIELVARVLKIDSTEAASWHPLERRGLLRFLALGDRAFLRKAQPSSAMPPVSPEPSTEPSEVA